MNNTTICAIATPAGGAIGIIRISGSKAVDTVSRMFKSATGKPLTEQPAGRFTYGTLLQPDGEPLDEVVVSLYRAPHSYTGEDSVEISCHGSLYILRQVMQQLIEAGCHQAAPGEFTQRAFLNGKMDLSRAEAVADLIASTSEASHRLAMSQLRGGFGEQLRQLRARLLHLVSLVELELDFSEEDVQFADRQQLTLLVDEVYRLIDELVHSFRVGNAVKNGVPVAIVGEPNSGKSTLLNRLLNEERAIVSDISGTTRDTIEETVNLQGTLFRLIDTAGLRDTRDTIENMGIQRTLQALEQSTLVLWLIDSTACEAALQPLYDKISRCGRADGLMLVFNKSDAIGEEQRDSLTARFTPLGLNMLFISAKQGENIDMLQDSLVKSAAIPNITLNDVIVTNVRHYEALTLAREAILRVRQGLADALPGDLLGQDLRDCIYHLSDILGEVTNDEVLQNIFKNFCIGK